MVTIQQLHSYHKLALSGFVPQIICRLDDIHGQMTPWVDEEEQPCFWCVFCNSKLYLSNKDEMSIKTLLHL